MKLFPQSSPPARILLTGARSPAAPDLVRWLVALGHSVTVSDCIRFPLARACRDAAAFVRYPPPRKSPNAFKIWMLANAARFDWIWPCCEEVFWLAQIPELPLFAPSWDLLRQVHDKSTLTQMIAPVAGNVQVPPTTIVSLSRGERLSIPDGFVAKPIYGRFGHRTFVGPTRSPAATDPEGWLLQTRICGPETCLFAIAHAGKVIAQVAYDDPEKHGTAPCLRFRRVSCPELEQFVVAFCREYHWTGQIGFDVMTDDQGRHWVLDANPRLTSGFHLIQRPNARQAALPFCRRGQPSTPNVLIGRADRGPSLIAPLMLAELWLRFGGSIENCSTANIQWP